MRKPMMATNTYHKQQVGPGGTITGSTLPFQSGAPFQSGEYTNYNAPAQEEETEPIR